MVCLGVALAGCAAQHAAPVEERERAGVSLESDQPDGDVQTFPLEESPIQGEPSNAVVEQAPGTVAGGAESAHPAVVALLDEAGRQSDAGDQVRAAANLERALKIEPQSALLWHRLATVRLRQGELGQAVALAAKSNTLAGGDAALQAQNWQLIAKVHRERGETAAAERAKRRADELAPFVGDPPSG